MIKVHENLRVMPEISATYFTVKRIELENSVEDGYDKDSLERFLNQYVSRGVQGPVKYFCETEAEVFAKMRIVMEFMQQNVVSVNEIFEMINSIELEQWVVSTDGKVGDPKIVRKAKFFNHQEIGADTAVNNKVLNF